MTEAYSSNREVEVKGRAGSADALVLSHSCSGPIHVQKTSFFLMFSTRALLANYLDFQSYAEFCTRCNEDTKGPY